MPRRLSTTRTESRLSLGHLQSLLGIQRGREGISAGEKRGIDVFQAEQKKQLDAAKYTVGKLTDAYQRSTSMAMKNSIISTLKGMQLSLPQHLQEAIEPFIQQSPISKEAEKRHLFRQTFPPPKKPFGEPVYSKIKSSETGEEYLHISEGIIAAQEQAEYQFAMADYKDMEKRVVFGSAAPVKTKKYIYLGNQQAAVRTDEGQVVLLNGADIGARALAKKYGVTVKDIWTRGDALPTGDKAVVIEDGKKTTYERTFNAFATRPEDTYGQRKVGMEAVPSGPKIDRPAKLTELLTNIVTLNEDDPTAKHFLDLLDEADRDQVAEELQLLYPNFTFVVKGGVSKKGFRTGILDWFFYNTKVSITPIPGTPQTFTNSAGKSWTGSVDNNGVVWSKNGRVKAQSVEDLLRMMED